MSGRRPAGSVGDAGTFITAATAVTGVLTHVNVVGSEAPETVTDFVKGALQSYTYGRLKRGEDAKMKFTTQKRGLPFFFATIDTVTGLPQGLGRSRLYLVRLYPMIL